MFLNLNGDIFILSMEAKLIPFCIVVVFSLNSCICRSHGGTSEENDRIIIIGAGMAGISAVKTLHDQGYSNFLILEGSDRVGGRTMEVTLGNYTVELGSLWIQGTGNSILLQMASKYNLSYQLSDYDDMKIYDESGNDITNDSDHVYEVFETAAENSQKELEEMVRFRKPDTTLRQVLITGGWIPRTPLDDVVEYYDYDFELAQSPDASSAIHAISTRNKTLNSSDGADQTVKDLRGYSHIHRSLLSEVLDVSNDSRILFNKRVTKISQNATHVTVEADDNSSYVGSYVISTFSVGVMQNKLVEFDPALPKWKLESLDQFQMTVYYHMYFQFPTKFWDDNEYFLFASSRRGYFPIWQNFDKFYPGSKILQATITGEEARRIDRMSDMDVKNEAIAVLQKMFVKKNIVIPEPTGYVIPRWLSNPLFKGCFSNWTPAYTEDMYKGLCAPDGRFYFAGEACVDNVYAYVQGAYFSGISTAESLLACKMNKLKCTNYVPEYLLRGCKYRAAANYKPGLKSDDGSCQFSCVSVATKPFFGYRLLLIISLVKLLLHQGQCI